LAAAMLSGQAPAIRAKQSFETVDAAPRPGLEPSVACVQAHTALLNMAKQERHLVLYRRGYCGLFAGLASGQSAPFRAAAEDFQQAIAAWPRVGLPPAGLAVLAQIARLEEGRRAGDHPELARELDLAVRGACSESPAMQTSFCNALVVSGRTWLGWLAMRVSNLEGAANAVAATPQTPWAKWIAGRVAQRNERLDEAASAFGQALDAWSAAEKAAAPDVGTLLGPKPDLPEFFYHLGLANFAIKKHDAAIGALDQAVTRNGRNAHAIFVRGRAKQALGLDPAALSDFALAIQTSQANNDATWPSGEASFYRGMLRYKNSDFKGAEEEFATAIEGKLLEIAQADVTAWRMLAAVSGGACESSAKMLEQAMAAASQRFPKDDAMGALYACRQRRATTLDQFVELEREFRGKIPPPREAELRAKIAELYADQGVAAEDKRDTAGALAAYRNAVEWNPRNAKARFNLGAIYLEAGKFEEAETQYRAVVTADASDFEAHYWLALSMQAQRPGSERKEEICRLLKKSVETTDVEKRTQFHKALAGAKCGG
jgi:tetratricopeptide (TPR) repeat protein